MVRLAQAKNVIMEYPSLYDSTFMENDELAESIETMFTVEKTKIADEKSVPLGSSKMRGLPHLPKGFEWPADHYFFAQLNLSDLADFDTPDFLPKEGIVYFFDNDKDSGDEGGCVRFYNGPLEELEIREYSNPEKLNNYDYYYEKYLTGSDTFKPAYKFYFNDEMATNVISNMPKELLATLENILECKGSDNRPFCTIFGEPQWWQEEDELDSPEAVKDLYDQGYMDEDEYNEAMAAFNDPAQTFLFQDDIGDGTIHFWIEENSFVTGDFSNSRMTYSGT